MVEATPFWGAIAFAALLILSLLSVCSTGTKSDAKTPHSHRAPASRPAGSADRRGTLLKHYTLAEDDLEHIGHRRRRHNRLGLALQLCALRYPGRLLSPEAAAIGDIAPRELRVAA